MERTKIGNQITMSRLGLDKKAIQNLIKKSEGKDLPDLASFLCVVTSHEEVPNKIDPKKSNTLFTGSFEGTNLVTGETGMASQAIFPENAATFIKGLLSGGEAARCAFVLGVEVNDKSSVGYYFSLDALTDKKNADPFKDFRAALPAPAKKSK